MLDQETIDLWVQAIRRDPDTAAPALRLAYTFGRCDGVTGRKDPSDPYQTDRAALTAAAE